MNSLNKCPFQTNRWSAWNKNSYRIVNQAEATTINSDNVQYSVLNHPVLYILLRKQETGAAIYWNIF